MAFYHAVFAARDYQTTSLHRLDLTVAHACEVSADDISCCLQHSLLVHQGLDVEPWSPREAGFRNDADWCVHTADLYSQFGDSRFNDI